MKINIQSVGFTAATKLLDFVESKLVKLGKFEDDIESADVFLRLEKAQDASKVSEIRLKVRGGELFAAKQAASFEEATDESLEALRRQLLKRKGKSRA